MAILCLNPDSIFRPKLVRIFIRGRQTPAYHINALFEIVQVLADILQLDLVRQSLMTPATNHPASRNSCNGFRRCAVS